MLLIADTEQQPGSNAPGGLLRTPRFLFACILFAFAVWVLAQPIFPTQDGPMHRYYVHVLDSLLQHRATYNVYQIRHPFPPYLTHYGTLLLLFHLFPYDWAEKLFTCIVLFCFAYGLRMSAREVAPAGLWTSLFCAPLLFAWPLMMGFFNFTLGIGLLLVCTAFWQRMPAQGGRPLAAFTLVLIVLTFTHPMPLLLLILLCGLDLAVSVLLRARDVPVAAWLRQHRYQFAALLLSICAAAFPALAIDSSKTSSTLHLFGFHPEFLRTSLLLSGMSPYNSRSLNVWIDAYRLCLYAIYGGAMWIGARAFLRAVRERRPSFGTTLFLATALLTIALPILPNMVNGSDYFTSRLVFVLWPAALLAASSAPAPQPRQQPWVLAAAALCSILTLIPAQLFIHPAGRQLHIAEQQPLPHGQYGALLLGAKQTEYARFADQLGFNPFQWSGILPFVHEDDVAIDSPWIDQKITPIQAVPSGPELVDDISYSRTMKPNVPNSPLVPGRSLPGHAEARIVHDASFMVFDGSPAELAQGLAGQLSPSEAAKYRCRPVRGPNLICVSGQD